MKIGIIDSGIHPGFLFKKKLKITKYCEFYIKFNGTEHVLAKDEYDFDRIARWYLYPGQETFFNDRSGHGTRMTELINAYYPKGEYIICRVLDNENRCHHDCFIQGLAWMIEQKPRIINLSLGMFNEEKSQEVYELTQKAIKENILICSATTPKCSYPAAFDTVFTVSSEKVISQKDLVEERMLANLDLVMNEALAGIPVETPSEACAMFTGMTARNLQS